jgi:hypothetical protein
LGSDPASVTRDRPRIVTPVEGEVDELGRWVVHGKIRLKPSKWPMRVNPEVSFLAETGGGTRVSWQELEATKNCTVDGTEIIIPANTREARFSGKTDPASHPVPATESCVSLDIRKFALIRGRETALESPAGGAE